MMFLVIPKLLVSVELDDHSTFIVPTYRLAKSLRVRLSKP